MTGPVINQRNNQFKNQRSKNPASNPIIDGYFPVQKSYREMAIARVNRTLCMILMLFILTSAVSYYFVTSNELTLNKYRKATLSLNDENVELQNKLDYLKSYYNVDKAMQKQHLLQKAKTVIEVKDITTEPMSKSVLTQTAEASQNAPQWSIGF